MSEIVISDSLLVLRGIAFGGDFINTAEGRPYQSSFEGNLPKRAGM